MKKYLKARCAHCHKFIDFPAHGEGRTIGCPHCGHETTLRAWSPELAADADTETPVVKRVFEPTRFAWLLLALGLIMLFFFPLGTIAGVASLVLAVRLSKRWVCSRCGNPVTDENLKSCPTCRAVFQQVQNQEPAASTPAA